MEGINFVKLKGFMRWPKPATTANGYPRFTARIGVPVVYQKDGEQHEIVINHNIAAWGPTAEGLGELAEGTPIEVTGHINTRSYSGNCKNCDAPEKKYWTEVQVDNFVVCVDEM